MHCPCTHIARRPVARRVAGFAPLRPSGYDGGRAGHRGPDGAERRRMGRSLSRARRVALALLATAGVAAAQAPTPDASPVKISVGGVAGPLVRARPRGFVPVRVLLENG